MKELFEKPSFSAPLVPSFKTSYDVNRLDPEDNNQEIVTVPDQSLTPAEILVRFSQGLGGSVPRFPAIYDDYPDLKSMTIEEKQYELQELNKRVSQLEDDVQYTANQKKQERLLASANKKLKKEPKEGSEKQKNTPEEE